MSKREFVIGTPMRQTIRNSRDKAEMEKAFAMLAEKLAPLVAELLEGEAPEGDGMAANGSNGRRMPPQDQWDTLPPGDDQWAGYDMNEPIGDESRNPYSPTGDHFANLPTD